ncbi:hypothetical protein MUP77_09335 [Candidatus Bathyarchaeota archaeon]|nr:hypothetical protein [Candidatus Bathyarchaeota archaeon]
MKEEKTKTNPEDPIFKGLLQLMKKRSAEGLMINLEYVCRELQTPMTLYIQNAIHDAISRDLTKMTKKTQAEAQRLERKLERNKAKQGL